MRSSAGTIVARYPSRRLEAMADADPRLGRRTREIVFEAVARSQARLLILGRENCSAAISGRNLHWRRIDTRQCGLEADDDKICS
jgi:hypothetical protein